MWQSATARDGREKFERFGLTPVPAERGGAASGGRVFCQSRMQGGDTRLVNKYNLFLLEVLSMIDPAQKNPKTIHHRGYGRFAVDGR